MNLPKSIDSVIRRAENGISERQRQQNVNIYGEGLKAKLRHVAMALEKLEKIVRDTESVSGDVQLQTMQEVPDEVYFYSDTFWAFLYSCLDVLGQVVTQAMKLGFPDEKDVVFKKVENHLHGRRYIGKPIQRKFSSCLSSHEFKELDKYRNCSTHRRRVYICRPFLPGTPEYANSTTTTSSVPIYIIPYFLCDDPYSLSPTTAESRKIPQYMREVKDKIYEHIDKILNTRNLIVV